VHVTIVAAVARNGVIGVAGGLPWHLPDDLRRFKRLTMGHVLVMGRRTYESIGHPLPGRTTVVVTRQDDWSAGADEVVRARDVPGALRLAGELDDEVFVVGGGQIYEEALPFTDRLELTLVDAEPHGDTVFPAVDWSEWRELSRESADGVEYVTYQRVGAAA
jgi:dihydrofolate reductase